MPRQMAADAHVTLAERLFDQLVQGLLDGEFAVRREVRAAASGTRDHLSLAVGKDGFGLGATGVDANDVGRVKRIGHVRAKYTADDGARGCALLLSMPLSRPAPLLLALSFVAPVADDRRVALGA